MKKIISLVLALLMCALVLTSCSVKKSGDDDTNTDAPAKPVLTVGYTLYEPMNYKDADGNLVGFDTELAQKVADKLGMDIKFQLIEWDKKYLELESGNINCIWNGFTFNCADDDGIQRTDKVDVSVAYMNNEQCVVVKADNKDTLNTADALKDKKGAAEGGSAGEGVVKGFTDEKNYIDCGSQTATLPELMSGNVDFVVIDKTMAKSIIGKGDYAGLAISDVTITPEKYAVGFKKGSDLTAKVDGAIKELAADGTLLELAKKYGLENYVITEFN